MSNIVKTSMNTMSYLLKNHTTTPAIDIFNNCADIDLLQKDNLDDLENFDIILANINLNVIAANSRQIDFASHHSAKILLSGFLTADQQKLLNNFDSNSFKHIITSEKSGWISMLLTKS